MEKKTNRFIRWWHSDLGRAYVERMRKVKAEQHKKYRKTPKGKKVGMQNILNHIKRYPEKEEDDALMELLKFYKDSITRAVEEESARWKKALEDNTNETLFGDEDSNEVMKISIKEFKEAVLTQITNGIS